MIFTCIVYLVSLISEYEGYNDDNQESGRGYLSEKNNFLNQYLVKLGWGWTFTLGNNIHIVASIGNQKFVGYLKAMKK